MPPWAEEEASTSNNILSSAIAAASVMLQHLLLRRKRRISFVSGSSCVSPTALSQGFSSHRPEESDVPGAWWLEASSADSAEELVWARLCFKACLTYTKRRQPHWQSSRFGTLQVDRTFTVPPGWTFLLPFHFITPNCKNIYLFHIYSLFFFSVRKFLNEN